MWLVVGLGNPGRRYAATRHNVGRRVVTRLASRWGGAPLDERRHPEGALLTYADTPVRLLAPRSFMNDAGPEIERVRRRDGVPLDRTIVVYDDVDLPSGRVRLRPGGGAGGHRGVESLIEAAGGTEFVRVRVGVGRPPQGVDTADWVLSAPDDAEEARVLDAACARAAEAVEMVIADGLQAAMNRINQREIRDGGTPL